MRKQAQLEGPVSLQYWHNDDEFSMHLAPKFVKVCSESAKTWWSGAIEAETERCSAPVVSRHLLEKHFSRNGLAPLCLSDVVEHMIKAKKLVPLMETSKSWIGWIGRGVFSLVVATMKLAAGSETESSAKQEVDGELPFLVVKTARHVASRQETQRGRCLRWCELASALGCGSSSGQAAVAAARLTELGELKIFSVGGLEFVKLKQPGTKLAVDVKDFLQASKEMLDEHCTKLRNHIQADSLLIKQHLSAGARDKAKALLRVQRARKRDLDQREAQLLNLDQLGSSLDSAQLDRMVLDAMARGGQALAELNAATPLEEVERVRREVEAAVSEQHEVAGMLAAGDDVMMQDMEAELEALALSVTATTSADGGPKELCFPDPPSAAPLRNEEADRIQHPAAVIPS